MRIYLDHPDGPGQSDCGPCDAAFLARCESLHEKSCSSDSMSDDLDTEEAQLRARLAEIQQERRARIEAVVEEAFAAIRKLDAGQRRLALKSLRSRLYGDHAEREGE